MKIYCVYTPAHEVLLRNWFIPSLSDSFELVASPIQIEGAGDFLSGEFLRCIRAKIKLIVESIQENSGQWILWSDVDILFFQGTNEALCETIKTAGARKIFFQRETKTGGEVNTGFVLIHCNEETKSFFQEVGNRLELEPTKNEQAIENAMLNEGVKFEWGYLPVGFVARTHGWPPSRRMLIYHANYTLGPNGVEQKIRQFKAVLAMQRYGLPATLYYVAKRVIEKAHEKFCRSNAR